MKKTLLVLIISLLLASTAYADLFTKFGSFSLNTNTGNQSIAGVGFRPKIVLFWGGTAGNDALGTFGVATSSSSRWAGGYRYGYHQPSVVASRSFKTDRCIAFMTAANISSEADFVSTDSDGFTINVTNATSTVRTIYYLALGGDSLLTSIGTMTYPAKGSEGDQSVKGVGFQPKVVLNMTTTHGTVPTVQLGKSEIFLGCGTSGSEMWTSAARFGRTNDEPSRVWTNQRSDRWHYVTKYDGTVNVSGTFVSMDSNGFTVNWSNLHLARVIGWIALGGDIAAKCGSFDQPTSMGNQSQSGFGFRPRAILFVSAGHIASNGRVLDAHYSLGCATSSSARGVYSTTATDSLSTTDGSSVSDAAQCIENISGSSPTVDSAADFISNDSDGFTINWTTADSTAREIVYFAIGATSKGGGGAAMLRNAVMTDGMKEMTGGMR
jgi:hypothetical protein